MQPITAVVERDAEALGLGMGAPADAVLGLEDGYPKPLVDGRSRRGETGGPGADDGDVDIRCRPADGGMWPRGLAPGGVRSWLAVIQYFL